MKAGKKLLFLAMLGCGLAEPAGLPQGVRELLGSENAIMAVQGAGVVDFCSVKSIEVVTGSNGKKRTADVLTPGNQTDFVRLSPEDAAAVKRLLLSDDSYEWALARFCSPIYTVRIRFHVAGRNLACDLCFTCDQARWSKGDDVLGGRDLKLSAADQLFPIFHKMMPGDPILAKLADLREKRAAVLREKEKRAATKKMAN